MRFRVNFTEDAEKEFLGLPETLKERVREVILKILALFPSQFGKPSKDLENGRLVLNLGRFSLIYTVDKKTVTIEGVKLEDV